MVASGRGAQMGVLFRDAQAIESLREIDTLVVDKTGTLTLGRPALHEILEVAPHSADTVLRLAAGLEKSSEHPLARAIVAGAWERKLEPFEIADFQSVTGKGVTGIYASSKIALGNAALMQDVGADTAALAEKVEVLRNTGRTVMFLAVDGALAGAIAVGDPIKDAPVARSALRRQVAHRDVDRRCACGTARAVAHTLGIHEVVAECSLRTRRIVARLQSGRRVMAERRHQRCTGAGTRHRRHCDGDRHGHRMGVRR
jgi:Cu+-exporting ATPase